MRQPNDREGGYPRLCAHRGYNMIAPENTLPAFALALSMGAQEIELDLWPDKDGDLVVCHDPKADRTTDGTGLITELTTKEVKALDAGSRFSPAFSGVRLPLFEEVLDLAAGRTVLNIHIKSPLKNRARTPGMQARGQLLGQRHNRHEVIMPPLPEGVEEVLPEYENRPLTPYDPKDFEKILHLLNVYRCRDHAYITGEADVLMTARELAPDMARCCLEGHMNYSIVEHALEYGCRKVQFCKGFTTQRMIDKAKANGLVCNLFWADTAEEAKAYFDIGIDCVLTNNFQPVKDGLKTMIK